MEGSDVEFDDLVNSSEFDSADIKGGVNFHKSIKVSHANSLSWQAVMKTKAFLTKFKFEIYEMMNKHQEEYAKIYGTLESCEQVELIRLIIKSMGVTNKFNNKVAFALNTIDSILKSIETAEYYKKRSSLYNKRQSIKYALQRLRAKETGKFLTDEERLRIEDKRKLLLARKENLERLSIARKKEEFDDIL